jgi:hypothetical protein
VGKRACRARPVEGQVLAAFAGHAAWQSGSLHVRNSSGVNFRLAAPNCTPALVARRAAGSTRQLST